MIKRTIENDGYKIHFENFSGVHDFINEYEEKEPHGKYKNDSTAIQLRNETFSEYRQEFTGAKGYNDAADKLKNGVNVTAIKAARAAAVTGTRRAVSHTVNGGRVCVPSYLSGSPACMRRMKKQPAKTELNVFIDTTINAGIDESQVIEAGKIIVDYISQLENRYMLNLTAGGVIAKSLSGYSDAYVYGIRIKDAGKPFSAARVSFCLTSPAFFRVFGFIWLSCNKSVPYMSGFGYPLANGNIERYKKVISKTYKNAVALSILEIIKHGKDALPKL